MSVVVPRVINHFGYSNNDDTTVACSDYIYLKPGEYPIETYDYEKEDKENNLKQLVERKSYLLQRLKTEYDQVKVAKIKQALANIEQTFSRNQPLVSKVIQKVYGRSL